MTVRRALAILPAALLIGAATAAADEDPKGRIAASQVGYSPGMRKEFTAWKKYAWFEVRALPGDAVALRVDQVPRRVAAPGAVGAGVDAWIGDFSGLEVPGRYRVVTSAGETSHPFRVGPDVFDGAIRAVQRWFYYQRAFTAIEMPYAEGPWVHPSDAALAPAGVRKGWHDAGDLSVYNASMNAAVFWLLETWSDFRPTGDATNLPESGNGVPDLLDEARWGLEWFLSVQDPDTGAFHGTTCQDAYPGYGRTTPNNVPPYQPGEVGTIDTARAVGALAYAAHVFQAVDPAFAKQCLDAALAGYAWLEERPDEHTDSTLCPAYAAGGDEEVGRHVRMYAAAALLLATNETGYADDFEAQYVEPYWISDYNRTNVYAAHLYLRAPAGRVERKEILRERLRTLADGTIDDGAANPFGWATHYYWGSLSNGFHRVSANVRMVLDGAGQPADEDQALANVHHLLGRSYYHFCFVGGLEGVEDGLQRGFHHWLQALDAKPRDYPGIVPGGPNEEPHEEDLSYPLSQPFPTWGYWDDPARPRTVETPLEGRYTDNDSWSTNEPAVNYQAATLYHLYFAAWIAANEPTDPGGEDAGEDVGTPEPVPDDGPAPDPGGGIPDAGPLPDAVAWADVRADEGPAPDAATGHDADRPDLAPPRDLAPAADLATAGTGDEPPGLHLDGGCSAGGAGGAGSGPAAWILPFLLAWLAARRPLRSRRVHG